MGPDQHGTTAKFFPVVGSDRFEQHLWCWQVAPGFAPFGFRLMHAPARWQLPHGLPMDDIGADSMPNARASSA
jgi:hypothetical protein